jgi:hypothetical protein
MKSLLLTVLAFGLLSLSSFAQEKSPEQLRVAPSLRATSFHSLHGEMSPLRNAHIRDQTRLSRREA